MRTERLDDQRQVAYAEYGDPEGAPAVFFHGTPGSRHLGRLLHESAREHGVRLLAPDRPGYGRSTPWPDREVSDAAAVVGAVLDHAGVERAGLVAFSGGAASALATAARRPERVTRVDLLSGATPPAVSESTPTTLRVLGGLATWTPPVLTGLFRLQAWVADRRDPSFVLAQYTEDPESVPEDVAETVAADFRSAFARHRRGAVTEFRNTASDWGLDLDSIESEVGVWHGSADANVPIAGARRLAERLPAATMHEREGDHLWTLLECAPDALARQAEATD